NADRKVVIVLTSVAVCLTLQRYLPVGALVSRGLQFAAGLGAADFLLPLSSEAERATFTPIGRLFYWSLACILTYYVIPGLVIRLVLKERMSDYGLKLSGAFAGFWMYALMLGVMLP